MMTLSKENKDWQVLTILISLVFKKFNSFSVHVLYYFYR